MNYRSDGLRVLYSSKGQISNFAKFEYLTLTSKRFPTVEEVGQVNKSTTATTTTNGRETRVYDGCGEFGEI